MPQIVTSGPRGTTVITFEPDQLLRAWEALGYHVTLAATRESHCRAVLHSVDGTAARCAVGASVGAALGFVTLAALDDRPLAAWEAWCAQALLAGCDVSRAGGPEPWV